LYWPNQISWYAGISVLCRKTASFSVPLFINRPPFTSQNVFASIHVLGCPQYDRELPPSKRKIEKKTFLEIFFFNIIMQEKEQG
jgi:hypothetical protein